MQVSEYGPSEVLVAGDAPDPVAGDGEVLVEVEAVEVLFLDTQLRAGWGREHFAVRPPWTPGTGVAGVVADPVTGAGRRVVARTGDEGAYATRVVVPDAEAVDVPDGLPLDEALAALHDGVLALDRLERAALAPGDRVLVTAAAGSVGHWLVPLARAAGAVVVGAAGGPAKVRAVTELGAEVTLDYREPGWLQEQGPFDVVFDGAGGEIGSAAYARTRDGGAFFAYGAASGDFATTADDRGVRVVGVEQAIDDATWRRRIRDGLAHLAAGGVRARIGLRAPLEQAAAAHRAMAERRVVGKTALVVSG